MCCLTHLSSEATRRLNAYAGFYDDSRIAVRHTGIHVDFDRVLAEGLAMVVDNVSDDELPSQYVIPSLTAHSYTTY